LTDCTIRLWVTTFKGERSIITIMTSLAPLLGTTPEEAHLTASTNYPLAVSFPFPFVVLAAPVILLRQLLGIEFLPGVT
jgi:hypothetical protein